MCDPASIALAVVPKLISFALQNQSANEVSHARAGVVKRTNQDIQKFTNKARQSYNTSFNSATPQAIEQGMQDQTAARTADYQGAIEDPQNIVSPNASTAAKGAIASALMRGNDYSKNLAALRAASEAYGGAALNRGITMGKANTDIGVQDTFARGREQVGQLQLDAANHAGDGAANMAGLVDAAGTVAGALYGPYAGTAPGLDVSTGIRWNTARQAPRIPAGNNPNIYGTNYLYQ